MTPYQFPNAVTIDLENLVAVDEIGFINASVNAHADWTEGEYCYKLVFKFADKKLRRYAHYDDKAKMIAERDQLIEDWKSGTSRSLVGQEVRTGKAFYHGKEES